jgi:hypothetical protein
MPIHVVADTWEDFLAALAEADRLPVAPPCSRDEAERKSQLLSSAILKLVNNTVRDCGNEVDDADSESISRHVDGLVDLVMAWHVGVLGPANEDLATYPQRK